MGTRAGDVLPRRAGPPQRVPRRAPGALRAPWAALLVGVPPGVTNGFTGGVRGLRLGVFLPIGLGPLRAATAPRRPAIPHRTHGRLPARRIATRATKSDAGLAPAPTAR